MVGEENDDPGEAHAVDDDRPEQHGGGGVRLLVGTVTRSGN